MAFLMTVLDSTSHQGLTVIRNQIETRLIAHLRIYHHRRLRMMHTVLPPVLNATQ